MNTQEAKFLLRAYRPGGQDAEDAVFSEALSLAKKDPALNAWQAREQEWDAAFAARLRECDPPAGLREAVLSGARVEERIPGWPRRALLALAACLAVGLGLLWMDSSWRNSNFSSQLALYAIDDTLHAKHGGHGEPMLALQAVLQNPATRIARGVPVDFAKLKANGCRTLSLASRDVLEVCFQRNGEEYHLYVALSVGTRWHTEPAFVEGPGIAVATWTDGGHTFALAGTTGKEAVRSLL